MDRLTEDIIADIISRLPIKHILRCRCVCKSWETILSSPLFAKTHFDRASTLNFITTYMINHHSFPSENLLYVVEDDGEEETAAVRNVKPVNFPFLANCFTDYTRAIFMGSCDGFLCFSTKDMHFGGSLCPTNPIYIFNPITGDHILLPEFKETRLYHCVHGFGFDEARQEYKVVVLYFMGDCNMMQVHTVGSDHSWRKYEFAVIPGVLTYVLETSLSLLFKGSLHWIILNSIDDKRKSKLHSLGDFDRDEPKRAFILGFQLDTENLIFIPMPEPLRAIKPYFPNSMNYALQLCGGCLSVAYSPSEFLMDIWVMKNYGVYESWTKQYSIQLSGLESLSVSKAVHKPLGFRKNGDLMLYLFDKKLVSYNTKSGKFKILKLNCELPSLSQTVPFPFVGSFISVRSAFGEKFADNEVLQTSEFGNPTVKKKLALDLQKLIEMDD